jgi:glucose dehydrogenase
LHFAVVVLYFTTSPVKYFNQTTPETIMLPLTRKRKFRIPNHLAVFAAVLLMVTSVAGLGSSAMTDGKHSVAQATTEATAQTPARAHTSASSKTKKNKGFKMSLFLFRNH